MLLLIIYTALILLRNTCTQIQVKHDRSHAKGLSAFEQIRGSLL